MADQIGVVSRLYCNCVRSGWRRDLRSSEGDCAERTCKHESGPEQTPNSRVLGLLNKLVIHLFVLQFSVLFHGLLTVDVVETQLARRLLPHNFVQIKWPYV